MENGNPFWRQRNRCIPTATPLANSSVLHRAPMRAVRITETGGPEVLKLQEANDPAPGPDEILVSVKATAVNRADLLQCMGLYPAPHGVPADIPGLEYAGDRKSVV